MSIAISDLKIKIISFLDYYLPDIFPFQRDSILFKGKVESESEFEKSRMSFYNIKKSYHDELNAIYSQK